jgi:tetratricopeptide (TPR) repeat protein
MTRMVVRTASMATVMIAALVAQQGGGGVGTAANDTQSTPGMSDIARPVFLSGRVLLEDGSPPPERVTIDRVCVGSPIPEGYTDSKGNFSFELGKRMGVQIDASTNTAVDTPSAISSRNGRGGGASSIPLSGPQAGFSERDLMSCELRVSLPGYTAAPVILAGRRLLDKPDLGNIILHPVKGVTGYTFSATTGLATKDARKSFDKGTELLDKRKFADAQKELEKAVAASPKFAAAWSSLGSARLGQGNSAGAMEAMYGQTNAWPDVARESQRVIELNPVQFPQAYFYNAAAHMNLKNYDQAEKSAREAIRLDEQHRYPRAEYLLGLLTAQKGAYAEAAQLLRGYAAKVQGPDLEAANKQLAEVERRLASVAK